MRVEFRNSGMGVEFLVKALPGSRRNEIRGAIGGALKISVTAVAEKGKANAAIVKFLSKELGITKRHIELVSGTVASVKRIRVTGIEMPTLETKIEELIDQANSEHK